MSKGIISPGTKSADGEAAGGGGLSVPGDRAVLVSDGWVHTAMHKRSFSLLKTFFKREV